MTEFTIKLTLDELIATRQALDHYNDILLKSAIGARQIGDERGAALDNKDRAPVASVIDKLKNAQPIRRGM